MTSDEDGSNQRLTEAVRDPLDRFMVADGLHQAFMIEAQHLERTGGKPDEFSHKITRLLEVFLVGEMSSRGRECSGRLRWLKDLIKLQPDSHEVYYKTLLGEYRYLVSA